jgi:lipopolysaccharide/colanic/teichoic acid biosynthesis glycosyltransferase
MPKKSALQKIEDHEKLCRIMQKQTFEQIKEMKDRIKRIEYMIVAGMGSLVLALLMNLMK